MENNTIFEPKPCQSFDFESYQYHCFCGAEKEYEDFLIGEYGAEKVLRVRGEEEKMKKMFDEMSIENKVAMLIVGLLAIKNSEK